MTDLAERKEEVKKKIRSLLLSAPVGLTLQELERDYGMFIGERLPSRDLGYTSAEEFLMSIPDTVQISRRGGTLLLKGVSDASTQHIQDLVSKQKVDTRKNWGVMDRRMPPAFSSRPGDSFRQGPRRDYPRRDYTQDYARREYSQDYTRRDYMQQPRPLFRDQPQRAAQHRNVPQVPAFVRGQIHMLLQMYPDGIPIDNIPGVFHKHFGFVLNHQALGFPSVYDLLGTLTDILTVRQKFSGNVWVMSVDAAVAKVKNGNFQGQDSTHRNPVSAFKETTRTEEVRSVSERGSSLREQKVVVPDEGRHLQDLRNIVTDKGRCLQNTSNSVTDEGPRLQDIRNIVIDKGPRSQDIRDIVTDKGPHLQDIRNIVTDKGRCLQDISNRVTDEVPHLQDTSDSVAESSTSCNIPVTIQSNIKQIMTNRPKGIWASRLPFEYKSIFKNELPHKTFGYNSVIEFVSDLSHIVRIERPYAEGDWHLLPANNQHSTVTPELPDKQACTKDRLVKIAVDESTKEAIYQVLCMHPNGVLLEKFSFIYKEMTGHSLDIEKCGARNLEQFLHSLPDILNIVDKPGGPMVCLQTSSRPRKFDKLLDRYRPTSKLESQIPELMPNLPSDVVLPGCYYNFQPLPEFGDELNFIQLYVSYVISPAVFWIQLKGRETTLALEDLMDELEAVYTSKRLPSTYHMVPALAKRGMICAAIFPEDGNWHRAIITGFKDPLFEVYYADYGNVCYVSIAQIRLLKTKFLKLPAQAIQARLSNIQPINGVWKLNSKCRLLDLCRETPLVGLVTNFKDGVLSLCLTDTTKEYDIHINDIFVNEGYSTFVQDPEDLIVESHSQAPSLELLFGMKELPHIIQYSTSQADISQHSTPQSSSLQHNTSQHSTSQHSTSQHSTSQHSTSQHSTSQHSTSQPSISQSKLFQHSNSQHSTSQHSTSQHSTSQHSTSQHSIPQSRLSQRNTSQHSTSQSSSFQCSNPQPSTSQASTSATPNPRRYIRQAQMNDDVVMNLINLDGQLYLLSSEISSLFFEEDILSAQLYKDNTEVPKLVVTRQEHGDLFTELAVYGAPNFTETTNILSLFSLSSLPLIIELYGQNDDLDEVKVTALEALEWFNPDDPYWKGENDADATESSEVDNPVDEASDMPSLEDLQLVLNSLEIKKKRILNYIMMDSKCAPENVRELNDVELNVKRVEALITKLQSALDDPGSDQSSIGRQQVKSGPGSAPKGITEGLLPVTSSPLLSAASSQLKSTQKVAPTMQTSYVEKDAPTSRTVVVSSQPSLDYSSCLGQDLLTGNLTGMLSQPSLDFNTLLKQNILLNQLIMEQMGISQEACGLPSLARRLPQHSFGRGVNMQQQQQSQPGLQPQTTVTQSFPSPLLSLGDSNAMLNNLQSLDGGSLLQQLNSLNARMATLGLSSLPTDNLSTSQLAGLMSPARISLSGQQTNSGGLHQSTDSMTPNWYSGGGGVASSTSLPNSFCSHNPSMVYGTIANSSVGGVSKGLAASALMQRQQFQ